MHQLAEMVGELLNLSARVCRGDVRGLDNIVDAGFVRQIGDPSLPDSNDRIDPASSARIHERGARPHGRP
jgi:hypothetical protein